MSDHDGMPKRRQGFRERPSEGRWGRRWKRPWRRLGKILLRSRAVTWLPSCYLVLCQRTIRWELRGTEHLRELTDREQGFVLAFWHECLPLMPLAWSAFWQSAKAGVPRKQGLVLVSRSRDGGMIGRMLQRFGLCAVAGSSSRGGTVAARRLLDGLRRGSIAVVVPDGPRGPRRRVSEGAVRLAAMAGVPVVPCAAHALPMHRIGTWDRMLIPLPFARGVAVAGRPILPDGRTAAFHAAVLQDALDMAADRAAEAVCA